MTDSDISQDVTHYTVPELNRMVRDAATWMTDEDCTAAAHAVERLDPRFSPRNRFLMWLQCPDVSAIANQNTWAARGRRVQPDRRLAFIVPRPSDDSDDRRGTGMRVAYLWDISGTIPIHRCGACRADQGEPCLPRCLPDSGSPDFATTTPVRAQDIRALLDPPRRRRTVRAHRASPPGLEAGPSPTLAA